MLHDKICAWEILDHDTGKFSSGGARPFKSAASIEKIPASDFFRLPYTKKQYKTFEHISKYADFFGDIFEAASVIRPYGKYAGVLRHTFGPESRASLLFAQKATDPIKSACVPTLYIDFEAMNMRVCGWYGELVTDRGTTIFEGIAKPYSDVKYVRRLWNKTYSRLLSYSVDDICACKHISSFQEYFADMFRQAHRICTYGDTDAMFIKNTFGNDLYHFFKVKNVDVSVRLGNRVL